MRIEFAEFVEVDWMAYSGAESFSKKNGRGSDAPLIAHFEVDGHEADAILDNNCLGIYWVVDDNQSVFVTFYDMTTAARVVAVLCGKDRMDKALTKQMFLDLGGVEG